MRFSEIITIAIASSCLVFMGCDSTRIGSGVSVVEANRSVHQKFDIPPTAEDVRYSSNITHTTVDLKISRGNFLSWSRKKGWNCEPIRSEEPEIRYTLQEDGSFGDTQLVHDGLSFDEKDGDFGFFGVFDSRVGRATVIFSSR